MCHKVSCKVLSDKYVFVLIPINLMTRLSYSGVAVIYDSYFKRNEKNQNVICFWLSKFYLFILIR